MKGYNKKWRDLEGLIGALILAERYYVGGEILYWRRDIILAERYYIGGEI